MEKHIETSIIIATNKYTLNFALYIFEKIEEIQVMYCFFMH